MEVLTIARRTRNQLKLQHAKEKQEEENTDETSVMNETRKAPKHTKQKKKDKHIEKSKPKKVIKAKYHQLTYALPTTPPYNNKEHCSCSDNEIAHIETQLPVNAEGKPTILHFYVCRNCKKPIQQYRVTPRAYCWQTYCKYCKDQARFYMVRGKEEACVLRCCEAYPFEIHEIEYANTDEFNAAVDQGKIKYICSKNPNHIRGHARKTGATRGTQCLDCMNEANATRRGKK